MGANLSFHIVQHGHSPDIIGKVVSQIYPLKPGESLRPLTLTSRNLESKQKIELHIKLSESALNFFEHNFKNQLISQFKDQLEFNVEQIDTSNPHFQPYHKKAKIKKDTFIFSCQAVIKQTDPDSNKITSVLSHNLLLESSQNTQRSITELISELQEFLSQPLVSIDEHTADQLIIFMCLASGTSSMTVGKLSHHSKHLITQIELMKQVFGEKVKIEVDKLGGQDYELNHIKVQGAGLSA